MTKYLFLICALSLCACQPSSSSENDNISDVPATAPEEEIKVPDQASLRAQKEHLKATTPEIGSFEGSYVGYFNASEYDSDKDISWANLITFFIDSVAGDIIYGHSVVAGNERPFQGKYTLNAAKTVLIATTQEPGDDRYDGKFEFKVFKNGNKIVGKWTAFKKLAVSVREYELEKRDFSYNSSLDLPEYFWSDLYGTYDEETDQFEIVTDDAAKYNASTQELSSEMIENMYKGDLEVMRNAIYARHGYSFKNRRMRYVFDNNVEWYIPYSTDIRNKLTQLELKNIALIKRYEQHAEAYYDSFGR